MARSARSRRSRRSKADREKTLPYADALDREDGGGRGGRYRDEASVYHAERKNR